MFLQAFPEGMCEIDAADIPNDKLVIGYVSVDELEQLNEKFGFDESAIRACRNANKFFRTGVTVYQDYTFSELRIINHHRAEDDYIALFIRRNMIIVVDIVDYDGSTKEKFLAAAQKYISKKMSCEKILAAFLESLLTGDDAALEKFENTLTEQEAVLLSKEVDSNFNMKLFNDKKHLSKRYNYYAQLLDITEEVCENENEIFEEKNLIYVDNVSKHINRLLDEVSTLRSNLDHLQEAYSSQLDMRMNKTMKTLTVLTSIFSPLTIIVGWYGMNFISIPEFKWRFGYLYVIVLSIVTVATFVIIGKRKKWF